MEKFGLEGPKLFDGDSEYLLLHLYKYICRHIHLNTVYLVSIQGIHLKLVSNDGLCHNFTCPVFFMFDSIHL